MRRPPGLGARQPGQPAGEGSALWVRRHQGSLWWAGALLLPRAQRLWLRAASLLRFLWPVGPQDGHRGPHLGSRPGTGSGPDTAHCHPSVRSAARGPALSVFHWGAIPCPFPRRSSCSCFKMWSWSLLFQKVSPRCTHPPQLLPPLAGGWGGVSYERQPLPKPASPALSCLTFPGVGELYLVPVGCCKQRASCLRGTIFSRVIDTSHHSPVFLEQLQGLLNLERKE